MSRAIVQQLIKLHQAQTRNIDHHCAKLLPAKEMRWLHLTPAQSSCEYFCKIVEAGIRIQSRTFFSNHKPNRSIPMSSTRGNTSYACFRGCRRIRTKIYGPVNRQKGKGPWRNFCLPQSGTHTSGHIVICKFTMRHPVVYI